MAFDDDAAALLKDFDPLALAAQRDPYPELASLRARCPVGRSETHGGFWNLFRYRDVFAAAVDAETFSSRDNTIPSEPLPLPPPPVMVDPPIHMQYRRPFLKRFSPGVVNGLEPMIRGKINELIDAFIERGQADLAEELFIPFPAFAALGIMGLPYDDFDKFSRWARLVFTVPEEGHADREWAQEVAAYYSPMYDALVDSTADDIPSIARQLTIDGRPIERMEFIMLLMTFVNAGLDTTTNSSAHIVLLLDERPDLREQLRLDPSLLPTAIEELLRYLTPLPMLARVTTKDVRVGDGDEAVTIPEGDKVALHWLAANHDPDQFVDPDQVLLDRQPNRHLAFGQGAHLCIGVHLARLQLRIVLEEIFRRMPDLTVVREDVVRVGGVTRQVHRLPVRFTPGTRETAGR